MKRSCVSIDLEIEKLGIDYRKLRIEVGREFPWHEVMAVRISGKVNDELRKSEMLPHFEKKQQQLFEQLKGNLRARPCKYAHLRARS